MENKLSENKGDKCSLLSCRGIKARSSWSSHLWNKDAFSGFWICKSKQLPLVFLSSNHCFCLNLKQFPCCAYMKSLSSHILTLCDTHTKCTGSSHTVHRCCMVCNTCITWQLSLCFLWGCIPVMLSHHSLDSVRDVANNGAESTLFLSSCKPCKFWLGLMQFNKGLTTVKLCIRAGLWAMSNVEDPQKRHLRFRTWFNDLGLWG